MLGAVTVLDVVVVTAVAALVVAATRPRPTIRVGDRVRIIDNDEQQNAFVGEVGTVVARGNNGYFVDLGDLVVPFDDNELVKAGWWL